MVPCSGPHEHPPHRPRRAPRRRAAGLRLRSPPPRLDPATGTLQHYAVPGPPGFVGPLVVAPDGNLWFGENSRGTVGRITTQGVITEFALPRYGGYQLTVNSLIVGHDGALWSAAGPPGHTSMALARVSLAGAIEIVTVTGVGGSEAYVHNPVVGPDGHLWMLLGNGNQTSTGICALVRDNRQ